MNGSAESKAHGARKRLRVEKSWICRGGPSTQEKDEEKMREIGRIKNGIQGNTEGKNKGTTLKIAEGENTENQGATE